MAKQAIDAIGPLADLLEEEDGAVKVGQKLRAEQARKEVGAAAVGRKADAVGRDDRKHRLADEADVHLGLA